MSRSPERLTIVRLPGRRDPPPHRSEVIAGVLGLVPVTVDLVPPQEAPPEIGTILESVSSLTAPFVLGALASAVITGRPDAVTPHVALKALVAVEGGRRSMAGLRSVMTRLVGGGFEVAVVHVFTDATRPSFWSPGHHEEAWKREFLMRYCDGLLVRLHVRSGATPDEIARTATSEEIDIMVVEWGGRAEPGRSTTLRALLESSPVPLLVVPCGWHNSTDD